MQATYDVVALGPGEVKPGNPYYGFNCAGCGTRFAVWNDASAGAERFTSKRPCIFKVACPQCGASRLYRTDQVQQFRA